jgi:hypothetical protein
MSWLARRLDWILVGMALILSVAWISNYIVHPIADLPTVTIVDDRYVPSVLRTGEIRETKEDPLKLAPFILCTKACNKFCFFPRAHRLKVEKRDVVSQVADPGVGFQEFFTHVNVTGTCALRQ